MAAVDARAVLVLGGVGELDLIRWVLDRGPMDDDRAKLLRGPVVPADAVALLAVDVVPVPGVGLGGTVSLVVRR